MGIKTGYGSREKMFARGIPSNIRIEWDGATKVWKRDFPNHVACLGFRREREALPRGSSPLFAFGGKVIAGEWFTLEEVKLFIVIYDNFPPGCGWVFEYDRPN